MELPVDKPTIAYTPRSDATPEGEIATLASIYRFILFESSASKEAARSGDRQEISAACTGRGGDYVDRPD